MTAQAPDWLIFDGKKSMLFSNPLADYADSGRPLPLFVSPNTANWRGYIATWEIDEGLLYLKDLTGWVAPEYPSGPYDRVEVGMGAIFPGIRGRIPAAWFTGQLRIPRGQQMQYVHMGYESVYEEELILEIQAGQVVNSFTVKNEPPQEP
jgi:hypothetical protein